VEAISHLRQGLALLQTLPETPERGQHEVDIHLTLGASLLATKGQAAPEVAQTYSRARQLCAHLEAPHQLFPVLHGLWVYHLVRAEYQTAHALGEQLLTLAQQAQDPGMLLVAHQALGTTLYFQGALVAASRALTQGSIWYDRAHHQNVALVYGQDPVLFRRIYGARTLWHLGYPDHSLAQSQHAVMLARQSAPALSLSIALNSAAMAHQFRREVRAAHEHAAAAISVTQEQGFPYWMALASILHGWALAYQGQVKEGIAQIHRGLRASRATGAAIQHPYFLGLLAEVHGTRGQPETGLTVLTKALALVDQTGERFYEAELYRLKGALLVQQHADHQAEAEHCFHHALDIARTQQAKSFELRAAASLSRLWQQQGKRQEGHALLAPVYAWFTEGFDTADLQEAQALLDVLA
jgi:predicted ATPase